MSSTAEEAPFQTLYAALWRQSLKIFENVPADVDGTALQYISSSTLRKLRVNRLGYKESILLIRKEFITAYDTFKNLSQQQGGVVVIGQPGIGKTVFLFYVLFRRLSEGLPTAFQVFRDRFFLFTENGAFEHGAQSGSAAKLPAGTWALTNSGQALEQPCDAFMDASYEDVWIVQATSPKRSRWYEWSKQWEAPTYVMDCFPANELRVLGWLLALDTNELMSQYKTWGPSARTCLRLVRGKLKAGTLSRMASAAAAAFASNPTNLFGLVTELDSDEMSNDLFFLQSTPDSREGAMGQIPTKHLHKILASAVAQVDAAQQSQFFTQVSSHPSTKGSASWIFEKFVHVRLTTTPALPLTCIPANDAAPTLNIPVCPRTYPLNTTSLREANKSTLPFYLRPISPSFPGIDSVVCTDSDIILVQATVASRHDINMSGLDYIHSNLPKAFRRRRKWHLVFITPTESNSQAFRNHRPTIPERWEILNIHSCTFTISQDTFSNTKHGVLAGLIDDEDEELDAKTDGDEEHEQGKGKKEMITFGLPRTINRARFEDKLGKEVVGEEGSHMTMQKQQEGDASEDGDDATGGRTVSLKPLDKGNGKAVEMPVLGRRKADQGPSSSKTKASPTKGGAVSLKPLDKGKGKADQGPSSSKTTSPKKKRKTMATPTNISGTDE